MSDSLVARVCGKYQLLTAYISCMLLMTTAEMNNTASQTCEALACENSNACQSSTVNDTHSGHAYCSCRGEWAGVRCELKLFVSAQSVTSQMVVLGLHSWPSAGHNKAHTSDDLFVSEVTVAIWNFNVSDQCLLLQQNMTAENVITLEGLNRQQEYLVCIANGFVDSCLFFQQQPLNISKLSTCIYFETKLFDAESFDIGFVAVPSAVLILIIVIIIFCYCQRRSLLVQLCLNNICCRNCYCLRKHVQRRQCLIYRQSDVSGEMLMPGDVSTDFESVSEAHTRAIEESNCRRTHSSNASSASRRSACSLDADGSVSVTTSLEHNTFLYENQSLIPPLYSPQDHKVMTLTYIDDDLIPLSTEHTVHNHIDTLFPGPYPGGFSEDKTHEDRMFLSNNTGCDFSKEPFIIPVSVMQKFTANQVPDSILLKEIPGSGQYTGPLKQQLLVHPYLHRPYHKSHIPHRQHQSSCTPNQFSQNEHGVRFREPNYSALRQRPLSLPLTYIYHDSTMTEESQPSNHARYFPTSPRQLSLINSGETIPFPLPAWPTKYNFRNNFVRSNSDTTSVSINYILSNATSNKCAMKDDEQNGMAVSCYNNDNEICAANTLPRSRKPGFTQPFARHSIEVSLLSNSYRDHQKPLLAIPAKRPAWLNISNPIQNPNPSTLAQATKPVSTETSTSSDSKSHSKQAKSLISHFEHNLSFLKPSKSNRPTDEEKEYQDLLSPLAADRIKAAKKSRHSHGHKTSSGNKTAQSNEINKSTFGPPVFEGHPSQHVIPPFATDTQDDEADLRETSIRNDASDGNSVASHFSKNGDSVISSYEDDDTNLVTPFDTENSSDDDTYKDIQSLTGSTDTLQDLEAEQLLLSAEGTSHLEHLLLRKDSELDIQGEESDNLLDVTTYC